MELNSVLSRLVGGIENTLKENLIGCYLQGSFAVGDWDIHSDVDFLVAIDQPLTARNVSDLQDLHARIYDLSSPWAQHLEGSYFPKNILRCGDPAGTPLFYLDNTARELIPSNHDNNLVVRWVVREKGILLSGPDPKQLIDPIRAEDLKAEILATMQEWQAQILSGMYKMDNRWAQPFVVLSYCRMLQTLQTGRIHSKSAGAGWARKNLDPRWFDLIDRALADRPEPSLKVVLPADPEDVQLTRDFMRYALEICPK